MSYLRPSISSSVEQATISKRSAKPKKPLTIEQKLELENAIAYVIENSLKREFYSEILQEHGLTEEIQKSLFCELGEGIASVAVHFLQPEESEENSSESTSDIKRKLSAVFDLYESNRRSGQTTALLNLVKQTENAVLVVQNEIIADLLRKEHSLTKEQVTSIYQVEFLPKEGQIVLLDGALVSSLCLIALRAIKAKE